MRYDRDGDEHYDLLSALQKSIRGSDPDAAVYYLGRLLEAGDLLSPCRRLLVIASEDIGLAYPQAMAITKACVDARGAAGPAGGAGCRWPRRPSCWPRRPSPTPPTTPSSPPWTTSSAAAGWASIPRHLQNVHADSTGSERDQGYRYPHDYPHHYVAQRYLPEALGDVTLLPIRRQQDRTGRPAVLGGYQEKLTGKAGSQWT